MSGANASPTGRSHKETSEANASPIGRSHKEMSGAHERSECEPDRAKPLIKASPIGRSGANCSEKGIGLVLALMILLLLSLLGAALLTATTVDVWIGDNYRTSTQLLYVTESGIEAGRETLNRGMIAASSVPFIRDERLLDPSGREAGRYSVSLLRANPLTLQSTGVIGAARKTIEVRLDKSGFPNPAAAITLSEGASNDGVDPRLKTPAGAERFVDGIALNATEIFDPAWDEIIDLGSVGSPGDYRVVVVNGNCEFGGAAGYGILLVRGDLTVRGNFTWNGLILVIGQGTMRVTSSTTTAWITGGVFLSRTRGVYRNSANSLGDLLNQLGPAVLDLAGSSVSVEWSPAEMDHANRRFPYIFSSYREY